MTGEAISANLLTGEATGAHLTGALGQRVIITTLSERFISYNIATYLFFQLYRKICKQSIWYLFSINQIITK